ncbi:DUF1932 domain-containing protein [Bradyrhizobium sp. SSUT18]|uniref:NAD(P)-dependent oxidoreductase n=1 Tax=Bradyrhizobium sp. SSUT18 TaxID=3040602 RepID=UPI00244C65DA|nr:DUF1932 domain-containing protein [Bradyrhizobium sp. SSUT18]MDH2400944.1 DUF1932 domain-containing protein [Bradyrhizobium sp. SSUT18]
MQHPRIGFVGFGEAAQCFASHLTAQGAGPILAYCNGNANRPPYSEAFLAQAARCGVTLVDTLESLSDMDVVFSAVVVAVAGTTGEAIAKIIRPDTLVIDINASTPTTKKRVAKAVEARGGLFADANLMGAVSLYKAAVPLYTSGSGAAQFASRFAPFGFTIDVASPEAGTAAAVKMLRSVVTKGIEALVVEALTAASLAGVRQEALRGICDTMDATTFSKFVDMCIRTDVLHAERRAVEMEGVRDGLQELGLEPVMTEAVVKRLRLSSDSALRSNFAARQSYSADDVLDAYRQKIALQLRPG